MCLIQLCYHCYHCSSSIVIAHMNGPQSLRLQDKPSRGKRLISCILGLDVWCVGCGSALNQRSASNPRIPQDPRVTDTDARAGSPISQTRRQTRSTSSATCATSLSYPPPTARLALRSSELATARKGGNRSWRKHTRTPPTPKESRADTQLKRVNPAPLPVQC